MLSPILFAVYLEYALRLLRGKVQRPKVDLEADVPGELIYADDTDFISLDKSFLDDILRVVGSAFGELNIMLLPLVLRCRPMACRCVVTRFWKTKTSDSMIAFSLIMSMMKMIQNTILLTSSYQPIYLYKKSTTMMMMMMMMS